MDIHASGNSAGKARGQASRPISIGKLNTLLCFHRRPINLVVYKGPLEVQAPGIPRLGEGFRLYAFSGYPCRT